MRDISDLKKELDTLDEQFQNAFGSESNEADPIFDGALDLQRYLFSPTKILWLMKEPYDEIGGVGGGWSFPNAFKSSEFVSGLVFGRSRPTWQPVTYTTFGILNNCLKSEMKSIKNDLSMIDVLRQIAWVNIQKLPSKGVTRSNMSDIVDSYAKHKHLLHRQIELLKPDVIICGSTFNLIQHDWELINPVVIAGVHYYLKENTLIINAYHPAQTSISRELYVNSIVSAVRIFKSTY